MYQNLVPETWTENLHRVPRALAKTIYFQMGVQMSSVAKYYRRSYRVLLMFNVYSVYSAFIRLIFQLFSP